MKLYGMEESGNGWKAATVLALTGHAFEWVHTDANAGDTQTTALLAGTAPTVADLAPFACTHRADEGEFDLARWPGGVLAWVSRMSDLPGITVLPRPDQVVRASRC